MARFICPTCHQPFDSEQSTAMPFCSSRCKGIDMKRWLSEEIAMPYREVDPSDRSELPDDPDDK